MLTSSRLHITEQSDTFVKQHSMVDSQHCEISYICTRSGHESCASLGRHEKMTQVKPMMCWQPALRHACPREHVHCRNPYHVCLDDHDTARSFSDVHEPHIQQRNTIRMICLSGPCQFKDTKAAQAKPVRGGGNSLRPCRQQRPIRTNLSCCLGLIDNGQYKSTNRLLVLLPHERPHGTM